MISQLSRAFLKLLGWTCHAEPVEQKKYVLIGAPHTSNWDFPLTLLILSALGVRFSWVAKHTIFVGPVGYLFRKIGGIPVDRTRRSGFLLKMVRLFQRRDDLILAISPEGTRKKTDHWKSGFYNLAVKAGVDIRLGYIDYPSKTGGLGPILQPSGDIEKDFEIIKAYYRDKTGKHPDQHSTIAIRPREAALFKRGTKEVEQPPAP